MFAHDVMYSPAQEADAVSHEQSNSVNVVNPLADSRWDSFVRRHPGSSVFHTTGWLNALNLTYGYEPIAVSTSPPSGPLRNSWVFCSVNSWLTGHRWVSLPFSDHCQPLIDNSTDYNRVLAMLESEVAIKQLRYFESRPLDRVEYRLSPYHSRSVLSSTQSYCFHHVDLAPDLETLLCNCHKSSVQRKIKRAVRERLNYQEGRSEELLDSFFYLQSITRHRHGFPPQPKQWFRNIVKCLGTDCQIRVAYKDTLPTAAILTLRHKDTMVFKYGASDMAYSQLGGMHLLLWKTIEEAKRDGLRTFDLGRSDLANEGLITFKDRWGSQRSTLVYERITNLRTPRNLYPSFSDQQNGLLTRGMTRLPVSVLRFIGERIYKHIG